MNIAVVDSGPLIHLNEIGALSLLRVFDELHLPDAVWRESVTEGTVHESHLVTLSVQRHAVAESEVAAFKQSNAIEGLHTGESECLCLCNQLNATLFLTDDLAARQIAERLGLTAVGSVGVIARACRDGLVTLAEAESYVSGLYDKSSLYVTRVIVDRVIEELRSHFQQ